MRSLLISALLVFVVSGTWANQKLYNKLNKLYLTDRNKCMDVSKKQIKKKPSESIPYYFSSIIYYDKSKESQTLKGAYLQMYRSTTNAAKFEKYSSETDKNLVLWDEHIASLKNRAERLIVALDKNDMDDLSANLSKSLYKIESIASSLGNESADDILADIDLDFPKNQVNNTTNETKIAEYIKPEGQFFGLPTGKENVLSSSKSEEQKLLELINQERTKIGASALVWNESFARSCRYHAYDQGSQQYFSHDSYDLINGKLSKVSGVFDRIGRFTDYMVAGECIAAGNSSAEETFQQWMNSPGHKSIIMDKKAKTVGIGFVSVDDSPLHSYWVLATGSY